MNEILGRWIIALCFMFALLFNMFYFFSEDMILVRVSGFFEIVNLLVMLNIMQWINN